MIEVKVYDSIMCGINDLQLIFIDKVSKIDGWKSIEYEGTVLDTFVAYDDNNDDSIAVRCAEKLKGKTVMLV